MSFSDVILDAEFKYRELFEIIVRVCYKQFVRNSIIVLAFVESQSVHI
jgi:hypothetical protein